MSQHIEWLDPTDTEVWVDPKPTCIDCLMTVHESHYFCHSHVSIINLWSILSEMIHLWQTELPCVCSADALYVATCNPVSLYTMKEQGDTIQCMELYDVFPRTINGVWQPFVTIAPLGSPLDGQVVLHEEQVGTQWVAHMHTNYIVILIRLYASFSESPSISFSFPPSEL